MRIPQSRLQTFSAGPAALPAAVEPQLTLGEEVVLLSLDAPRRLTRHVVRVAGRADPAGPRRYDEAVRWLQGRGLLARGAATPAARLSARVARVRATIHRAAPPRGRDAELLMLLAATGSLPLESRSDHLQARVRLASIAPPPRAVTALADELGLDAADLVERLLPAPRDVGTGSAHGSSVFPAL
jgi:hypothetical protein